MNDWEMNDNDGNEIDRWVTIMTFSVSLGFFVSLIIGLVAELRIQTGGTAVVGIPLAFATITLIIHGISGSVAKFRTLSTIRKRKTNIIRETIGLAFAAGCVCACILGSALWFGLNWWYA